MPYDQFAIEQIAGDLLTEPRLHPTEKFNESIIGTGFWWFGEQVHAPVDLPKHEADRVDNQIDVLGKTFLGLTLGCARCHDHKFDAISTADVYSLWGFAKSTRLQTACLDPHGKIAAAAHEIAHIQRQTIAELSPSTSAQPSQNQAAVISADAGGELLTNFNGADFGDWHASGEAFGRRPTCIGDWTAQDGEAALLPVGCAHSGRFANKLTGDLRSSDFTIEKPAIAYRIAGKNAQVRLIIQGYRMDVFNPLLFSGCSFKVDKEQFTWHVQAADVPITLANARTLRFSMTATDGWRSTRFVLSMPGGSPRPKMGRARVLQMTLLGPHRKRSPRRQLKSTRSPTRSPTRFAFWLRSMAMDSTIGSIFAAIRRRLAT